MSKTKVEPKKIYDVDFEDQKIETVMSDDGERHVVVRRICDNLGIDYSRQLRRLQSDTDFNCGHMSVVAQDSKIRDMACLPLSQYYGWLMMINSKKVKSEIRPLLSAYRKRSIQVLNDFWTTGMVLANENDKLLVNALNDKAKLEDAIVNLNNKVKELQESNIAKDTIINELKTNVAELTADKKNLVTLTSKKNNYITKLTDEKADIVTSTFTLNNTIESQRQQIQSLTDKITNIYAEGNLIIDYQKAIIKQYQIITGSGFNF